MSESSSNTQTIPLLAIVGPTAVGKTALSLTLAQTLNGEIVSADSRQIYRGMDIGTAKPTLDERATIPHYLINIVDPDEEYSLALYKTQADAAIEDIAKRRRLPLLVGGTGQYLAAVLQGWSIPSVPPQPAFRAQLEHEADEHGAEALHARLVAIDPVAAAAIPISNVRRVIRALEVYHVTGQPISAQQQKHPPSYQTRTIWLTLAAEPLYERIDERVDAMMSAGLLEEVRSLLECGYTWNLPAMSSLGYREFQPYFAGTATREEAVQRLKFNTHAFARRQRSWFRRLPGMAQIPADAPDLVERALAWWHDGTFDEESC